jgi:hypothetical protein
MHIKLTFVAAAVCVAGCATTPQEPFDPGSDPRIGAEVDKACFSDIGSSGGYRRVGDRDAFVTGSFKEKYVLVFSNGCRDLRFGSSFPVFRDYGDRCRRRSERVESASLGSGVTGACVIEHIYEWDKDGAKSDEAEDS